MEKSANSVLDIIKGKRLLIGASIKNKREEKNYSQEQLAKLMDVSRTTISKIENGNFNLSINYLIKFSIFLEFEIILNDVRIK